MKKLISSIITVSLLLSSLPVFANGNADKTEEMLLLVKGRTDDTSSYEEFNSYSHTNEYGITYDFSWSSYSDENYKSLNIQCNDKGVITSYQKYDSQKSGTQKKLSINRPKSAEAMDKAKKAIDKLNPAIADSLIVFDTSEYENFQSSSYQFNVQRYENGIPVYGDSGYISLNSSLELESFNILYTTGLDFSDINGIISEDTAIDEYNKKIGADIYYTTFYDKNSNEPEIKLMYSYKCDNNYIDAKTGEVITIESYYDTFRKENSASQDTAAGSPNKFALSEAETKNIEELNGLISLDDADKAARAVSEFEIDDSCFIRQSSLSYDSYINEYFHHISYANENNEFLSVNVNAKNGEIYSFYHYSPKSSKEDLDSAKISELGEKIAKKLSGEKFSEYKKDESKNSVVYTRYVNGIRFPENTINITFNDDYSLETYNISYHNTDFPKPENIISQADAFRLMRELGEYKTVYIADYKNNTYIPVYHFEGESFLDAFTGKPAYCEESDTCNYTDISGHWAENEIKTLAEYGIFFKGNELNPDNEVTQSQFLTLLSIAFYRNSPSSLRYSSDIHNFMPPTFFTDDITLTSSLTRSHAATLMIRALGIEEYAELSDIYKPLYNDVTENIGSINILTGLGVVSGDGNGNFNPEQKLTKAQSLMMIYNYLSR